MEPLVSILLFFAGLWIGGAIVWFVMNMKIQQAAERAKAEGEGERAALAERLAGKETQVEQLRTELDGEAIEVARLRGEIKSESEKRAAAEERSARAAELHKLVEQRDQRITELQAELTQLRATKAELDAHLEDARRSADEKLAIIQEASEKFSDAFRALSAEALKNNNRVFLDMAGAALSGTDPSRRLDITGLSTSTVEMLGPVLESLERVNSRIQQIEQAGAGGALLNLAEQVNTLAATQAAIQRDTASLASLLKTPSVRGRWTELQLQRVVEMAGMQQHCDFVEHDPGSGEPVMIIKLPNGRHVVVDARLSLAAYWQAMESADEMQRTEKLQEYAAEIRHQLTRLGGKAYWEQFEPAPEFVISFVPGESFFGAAVAQDPSLIEFGAAQKVLLATPLTLIALLKAIAYGWKQERIAEDAQAISEIGRTLYERLRVLAEGLQQVQRHLQQTNGSFNQVVGVLETRVLSEARRLREFGAASDNDIDSPAYIDTVPRSIQALDLVVPDELETEPAVSKKRR